MAQSDFFPARPDVNPQIYAYRDPNYPGQLKVGYTATNVQRRVAEQYPTKRPGDALPYSIEYQTCSMREDGTYFMDKAVHRWLRRHGKENTGGEWFRCTVADVKAAVVALRNGEDNEEGRTETFDMRPEQERAVEMTAQYFQSYKRETGRTPHFLWNCKMRFGKTFAAYQLARRMGWKRILVLTFKPAVESAWEEDLRSHVDFKGWQFVSRTTELDYDSADKKRPIVWFGSFQDFLGKNKAGGIKLHNEWAHMVNWDAVIFDEYHYGAWRESAKDLFYNEDKAEQAAQDGEALDYFSEENMPITTSHYLYLSGTPFRAINSGEFIEEQIFNWTYSDEQAAKAEEQARLALSPKGRAGGGFYAMLPRMVLMTYQLPEIMVKVAQEGEFDEFDLNAFFEAKASPLTGMEGATFTHEDEVQKWLDLIRGAYKENIKSDLVLRSERPPMPFSHAPLLRVLNHTFWFLPDVAACYAMRNLLAARNNTFYHDFKVVVAAGPKAGIGLDALPPVQRAMGNPLETRTITLSCGKLITGVSVRPWTGIFMLRNSKSPETYFQAAFRVQTPWVIKNPQGNDPAHKEIMKQECYVFDFAPNRALRQIAEYSCRLNVKESNPEKKVEDFIRFLPVLAYDGSHMKQIDAAGILDIAMSGTSATLLARRWESALLVNVDNNTLQRLLNSPEALAALMKIEGFRSLNKDIETIINKSEKIKALKREANERDLSQREKKELTAEEKEMKSKRKMIQEKLIKFATRVPIFMYLTDYREQTLKDVITQLEPGLFHKVTGLEVRDFELLVSLNVFNSELMNDAVFKFKRYEDASLEYIGFDNSMKDRSPVGGYDTVETRAEFEEEYFRNEE
ncbi:MAG: GIY-YIG nuclease family protein [Bacteroidales bacterium]|nr:GIY-YIG nuclease family protein [Candidatus Equimonas faecalis]